MQWGRAAITGGEPDVARRELTAALALARRTDDRDLLVRCIYFLGALEYQQGDVDAAGRLAEEALAMLDAAADAELVSLVHNLAGSLANLRSRFDVAEHHLRLGLDAARAQQCPSRIGTMLCSLAVPVYYRGDYAEAATLTEEAARVFEALGKHVTVSMVRGNLAAIEVARGDLAAAQAHAGAAVRLAQDAGDANLLSGLLATQGDLFLRQGGLADARRACEESLRVAQAVRQPLHVTEALFLLAEVELAEGRRDRALEWILRLRDVLSEHRLEVRVPMLILAAAEWAWSGAALAQRRAGRRWAAALSRLGDVDATLRAKAQGLLDRDPASLSVSDGSELLTLVAMESQVKALLASVAGGDGRLTKA
jgi:tetratricopeptide (TPR) repeat protein